MPKSKCSLALAGQVRVNSCLKGCQLGERERFACVRAICFNQKLIASLFILVVVFPCSVNAVLCVRVAQKITRLSAATRVKVIIRFCCATPPIFSSMVGSPPEHRVSHICRSLN
jgi:predicted metallopeptidase